MYRDQVSPPVRGVTRKGYLPVKPLKRSNERSERVWDAHVRLWERLGRNGSDIRGNGGTRQSATIAAPDTPKRAKAAKSGRPPRAPEEGALVPLGTDCTPHPPCVIPVPKTRQERRLTRAPPTQVQPAAPDWRGGEQPNDGGARAPERRRRSRSARATASPGSRSSSSARWSSVGSSLRIGSRSNLRLSSSAKERI